MCGWLSLDFGPKLDAEVTVGDNVPSHTAQHMQKLKRTLRFNASHFFPLPPIYIVADPCFATPSKQVSLVHRGMVCMAF